MEEGGGLQGFQLLLSCIIISLISKFHNSVLFISFSTFLLENHAFSFMFKLIFFLPCILKIDFLWKINNKTSNFGVSTAIVNSADISLDGSRWFNFVLLRGHFKSCHFSERKDARRQYFDFFTQIYWNNFQEMT